MCSLETSWCETDERLLHLCNEEEMGGYQHSRRTECCTLQAARVKNEYSRNTAICESHSIQFWTRSIEPWKSIDFSCPVDFVHVGIQVVADIQIVDRLSHSRIMSI